MNKAQYQAEKDARKRLQRMKELLKTGKGTFRVRWEGAGEWVYDSEAEAQADAERLTKENEVVVRAWVEGRELQ